MKTTFDLDRSVLARLKRESVRQRCTVTALVEAALRIYFKPPKRRVHLPELPSHDFGKALVGIDDRDALYRAMDGI